MSPTKRTILIVEDDQILNKIYKIHCEEVLAEFPHVEGIIEQAFDYPQAHEILTRQPVDFVSVDIALSKEEEGKTDAQREYMEARGMALLRQLQGNDALPMVVVVTGESLQSYAIDAYQEYGVLAFYQKDRFNNEEYKNALKAVLWYLDAAEAIDRFDIDLALENWQKVRQASQVAGIKERGFENLGYKIKSIRNGLTHPVTGLPVGRWTEQRLKRSIVGKESGWAVIRVLIRGFDKFVAAFASQEKPILSFVGELLKKVQAEFQDEELFIGHLGYYEHVPEPVFVIIPGPATLDRTPEIARWVENEFAKTGSRPFAPDPELKNSQSESKPEDLTFILEARLLPNREYSYFPDLAFLLDTLGSAHLEAET